MQVYDKGFGNSRLGIGRVRGVFSGQFFIVALFQRTKGIPQRTKMTCSHRTHSGVCDAKRGEGESKALVRSDECSKQQPRSRYWRLKRL